MCNFEYKEFMGILLIVEIMRCNTFNEVRDF
jgi:hypothetical protein